MGQIVSGIASGGVYALLALALVIIHRSTGVINFAQGEMATLSTYIAWALITEHGWRYWPAFVATLVLAFVGGVAIHRIVIRPVERGNVLRIVIVTIGLLIAINGLVGWIWGGETKALDSPFPNRSCETTMPARRSFRCSWVSLVSLNRAVVKLTRFFLMGAGLNSGITDFLGAAGFAVFRNTGSS